MSADVVPCPNCEDGICTECGGDGCDECSGGGNCPDCDGTGLRPGAREDDGWHFGPDGSPERGFLAGTAFQPDGIRDHMDSWGTPHPDSLSDCTECRAAALLIT